MTQPIGPMGWIPFPARTLEQHEQHERIVASLPVFPTNQLYRDDKGRFALWQVAEKQLGRRLPYNWQLTGSCFLPGTPVLLEGGAEKPIQEFRGGETVVTHRGNSCRVVRPTSRTFTGDVCRVKVRDYASPIFATADHRFLTASGDWLPIGDFGADQKAIFEGRPESIYAPERQQVSDIRVYCLEVEQDHSFVAGGFAVHNCVGAGGGNMAKTMQLVEIALGDPEEYRELWWPFTYGRSRFRGGMTTPGEGSFGSVWAEAALQDGFLAQDEKPGLPAFSDKNGWLQIPSQTEISWSDGDARQSLDCLEIARVHLFRAAAQIRNSAEARAAHQNGYAITLASMFGTRGPRPRGNPSVMVADWDDQWAHQMYSDETWDHPDLGVIHRIGNNWGPTAHPAPTQGEPPGGFYVTAATFDRICGRDGEVYAFSGFGGFPARSVDWLI